MDKRQVATLIYDDAEVLDFAGPFEVFSVTAELAGGRHFDVSIVGEEARIVRAVGGLQVLPHHALVDAPRPDVLVVSGGDGSRRAMTSEPLLGWLAGAAASAEVVLSVCSGSRLLARLGLLDGLEVTTHHEVFEHLRELAPRANLRPDRRVTDNGRIVTTGGISAGIDGAFHVVARLLGTDTALATARYMEYDWEPGPESLALGSPEAPDARLASPRRQGG